MGFTGQLLFLDRMLRLGKVLQYQYLHTTLSAPRSSNAIYEFLGVNQHFDAVVPKNYQEIYLVVPIIWNQFLYDKVDASSEEMKTFVQDHVATYVQRTDQSRPILVIFCLRNVKQAVFLASNPIWRWLAKSERVIDGHIWSLLRRINDRLNHELSLSVSESFELLEEVVSELAPDSSIDFRQIYETIDAGRSKRQLYESGQLNVLVHIRQGDTAVVETPWGTFLPVARFVEQRARMAFAERKSLDEIGRRYVAPADFFNFLKSFTLDFEKHALSIVVASDGFKRAFQLLLDNRHWYGFSAEQYAQLKLQAHTYDEQQFAKFEQLPLCEMLIGETDETLFCLVDAALKADIIVIGSQQRMLPKLLSLYAKQGNRPIFVLLHNEDELKVEYYQSFLHKQIPFFPFHIDRDPIASLTSDIEHELFKMRKK